MSAVAGAAATFARLDSRIGNPIQQIADLSGNGTISPLVPSIAILGARLRAAVLRRRR
jgi:hypothetical protein